MHAALDDLADVSASSQRYYPLINTPAGGGDTLTALCLSLHTRFTNTTQSIPYAALSGRLWHDHASFVRRHLDHRCHPAEAPHRIGYNVGGHSVERVAVLRGE